MSKKLRRNDDLPVIALSAQAYAEDEKHDEYTRGYAAGVEDLARLLYMSDPAISDRLVDILRLAGRDAAIPRLSR